SVPMSDASVIPPNGSSTTTAPASPLPLTPPFSRIVQPSNSRSQSDSSETAPCVRLKYTRAPPETSTVALCAAPTGAPFAGCTAYSNVTRPASACVASSMPVTCSFAYACPSAARSFQTRFGFADTTCATGSYAYQPCNAGTSASISHAAASDGTSAAVTAWNAASPASSVNAPTCASVSPAFAHRQCATTPPGPASPDRKSTRL